MTADLSSVTAHPNCWIMLPHGDCAVIDLRKLSDYVLSAEHVRGRHKARFFARAFGTGPDGAGWLRDRIVEALPEAAAVQTADTPYSTLYQADLTLDTSRSEAVVRTAWIVRRDETFPRLTTRFVL